MRRRLAALVVAVGLATGLVAGCGIPDHTEVKVEGPGPVPGPGAETNPALQPPDREEATDMEEFVKNFLQAPAGEFERSLPRVKDYLSPDQSDDAITFKSGLTVVWVDRTDIDTETGKVRLTVRQVGVLNANGEIAPPTETATTYDMEIRPERVLGGFSVTKPPKVPLLNAAVLPTYYTDRTVYFWNSDRSALVPDLRWLPREVGADRVPTELLKMIENGPSSSLDGVASELAAGSKLLINAPNDNGQLTMNWSPAAVDNNSEDYLAQQVAWTVRGRDLNNPQKLQLKINGQALPLYDNVEDLLNRKPYPIGPEERAYSILDGEVRALAGTPGDPPLAGAADQNVRWAAFNRTAEGLAAAVVTNGGELRVGTASGAPVSELTTVRGIVPNSPPAWLPRSQIGLAVTDDGLYQFDAAGRSSEVDLAVSGITAVATAPDGQRIALLAGGQIYVVPVSLGQDGALAPAVPRRLTRPLDNVTAIAWGSETSLAVGGTDDSRKLSIYDVTIDGARRISRVAGAQEPISMIAAYPESTALNRPSNVLYQAGNTTWLTRGGSTQLGRLGLAGEAATPSPGTDQQSQPTAPFFVY